MDDRADRRQAELDAVIEAIPDAVMVGDLNGVYVANRAALELLGFDSVEQLNENIATVGQRLQIRDAATGAPSDFAAQAFPRALRGETTDREAMVRHQRSGRDVFVRSRGAPIHLDDHERAAVAVLSDITPLRLQQQELRLVADAVPVHLLHLDREERILFVNQAAASTWGFHPRDMVGKTVAEVLGTEVQQALRPFAERVLRGEPVSYEASFATRQGLRHFLNTYVPDRALDGSVRGFIATGTDITDRKRAEDELRASRASEQASRERLEQERALREQFVSTLTHDVRTPLSAAKMSAALILRHGDDPDRVRKLAGRIVDAVERADGLMRDLLDASLIRAGGSVALQPNDCDLAVVISDVVQELTTVHGARFLLRTDPGLQGQWDCVAVRRVLENLCTNAVKYGAPDAPITIQVHREGHATVIEVHNEGEPISPTALPTLFEPFRRAPTAETSGKRGWGLGLTLVKGIAEAHGGNVEVTSDAATGTTFRVTLPVL